MNPTEFSDWPPALREAAMQAMQAHADRNQGYPAGGPFAFNTALRNLMDGTTKAALIGGGYLLIYDHGPTWCSDETFLFEQLLVRMLPVGTFNAALADMVDLARHHGCKGVITGNGVLRPGLQRMYERAGFRHFNQSFYMEV